LSSVGVEQAGKDAVEFLSAFRSGPKTYLAKDHQRLERLIRVIVRGGTPGCRILPHVIIVYGNVFCVVLHQKLIIRIHLGGPYAKTMLFR
jgi:hypothetical protein